MKRMLVSLLLICSVSGTLCAQQSSASASQKPANAATTLAITHVAVVDLADGTIKQDMTVIINDGAFRQSHRWANSFLSDAVKVNNEQEGTMRSIR